MSEAYKKQAFLTGVTCHNCGKTDLQIMEKGGTIWVTNPDGSDHDCVQDDQEIIEKGMSKMSYYNKHLWKVKYKIGCNAVASQEAFILTSEPKFGEVETLFYLGKSTGSTNLQILEITYLGNAISD